MRVSPIDTSMARTIGPYFYGGWLLVQPAVRELKFHSYQTPGSYHAGSVGGLITPSVGMIP